MIAIYTISLLLLVIIILTTFLYEYRTKVVSAPTLPWVANAAIKQLAEFHSSDAPLKIADLGCGWGGPMIKISRAYKNASIDGFELSPWPFLFSWCRALFRRRIKVARRDIFTCDLANYDVIFCYLLPWHLGKLRPQFEELRTGTIVISCSFAIDYMTPIVTTYTKIGVKIPIYLYRID